MRELVPVDFERCQAMFNPLNSPELRQLFEKMHGSEVPPPARCESKPVWIATEPVRDDGEEAGKMSLCSECKAVCEREIPGVTFELIENDIP
jgi:hypothetical protein